MTTAPNPFVNISEWIFYEYTGNLNFSSNGFYYADGLYVAVGSHKVDGQQMLETATSLAGPWTERLHGTSPANIYNLLYKDGVWLGTCITYSGTTPQQSLIYSTDNWETYSTILSPGASANSPNNFYDGAVGQGFFTYKHPYGGLMYSPSHLGPWTQVQAYVTNSYGTSVLINWSGSSYAYGNGAWCMNSGVSGLANPSYYYPNDASLMTYDITDPHWQRLNGELPPGGVFYNSTTLHTNYFPAYKSFVTLWRSATLSGGYAFRYQFWNTTDPTNRQWQDCSQSISTLNQYSYTNTISTSELLSLDSFQIIFRKHFISTGFGYFLDKAEAARGALGGAVITTIPGTLYSNASGISIPEMFSWNDDVVIYGQFNNLYPNKWGFYVAPRSPLGSDDAYWGVLTL